MHPYHLDADNVNDALARGLQLLTGHGAIMEPSRNGAVHVWDGPVVIRTKHPMRRVLFSQLRDANPFFHLFEAMWMLGGRNDLPWLAQFNKRMIDYSDDGGKTQPAAYGYRWRKYFGYDQLELIAEELVRDPKTRRCVLAMWDGWGLHQMRDEDGHEVNHFGDLNGATMGSKDVPCNTQCYFTVRDGALHMGVTCRSNDILWGAHGANAVHFSVLLEYMAAKTNYQVGEMIQFSWNYHLYDGILKNPVGDVIASCRLRDYYNNGATCVTPLFTADNIRSFDEELPMVIDFMHPDQDNALVPVPLRNRTLRCTILPMYTAWRWHKKGRYTEAINMLRDMMTPGDWQTACIEWLERRLQGKLARDNEA